MKFENSNKTSSSLLYALYFYKVLQFQVTGFRFQVIKIEHLEARICGVISCDVTKTKFENSNLTSSSISNALYFCKVSQFQVTYF